MKFKTMGYNNREKEIIYFALSRLLEDSDLSQKEFNEIDNLREQFYQDTKLPTFGKKYPTCS